MGFMDMTRPFHNPRVEKTGMEATMFGLRYQGCVGNKLVPAKRQIGFVSRANVKSFGASAQRVSPGRFTAQQMTMAVLFHASCAG